MERTPSGSWLVLASMFALAQGCATPTTLSPYQLAPMAAARPAAVMGPVVAKSAPSDAPILVAESSWQEPAPIPPALKSPAPPAAPVLTREKVLEKALEHNPQLVLFREQRGLAAAGVVLAKIYPYNLIWQSHILGVNGPTSAGVTNHVFNEHYAVLPLEIAGQGAQRRAAAAATATRTEWEIAAQEVATAIGVLRAYDTVLYREQKVKILEETVLLNEQVVKQGKRLAEAGRLGAADVLFASTELDAARAQIGQGRTALAVARADLQRQLGVLDEGFSVAGELEQCWPDVEEKTVVSYALEHRPEIRARAAGIADAEARLKLQIADRYGNLAMGPRYDYSETRASFIGVVLTGAIPVLNTRQGEIAQRQADLSRARVDLKTTEFLVTQSVDAAFKRLTEARKWAARYSDEVLPNLNKARKDIEKLFAQNEQGVDVLRVIGVQRNLLRASDAYLDARFEVSQARLDLAAAVGEPALAICETKPEPTGVPMSAAPADSGQNRQ